MKKLVSLAVAGAVALFAGNASAAPITVADTTATIDCTTSCEAFTFGASGGLGTEPDGMGTLSDSLAWWYAGEPSNENAEADRLSILISGATGVFSGSDGTRSVGSGGSQVLTTMAEYIVLKLGNVAVFIKNTSGGLLEIDYSQAEGLGLSHYTEFGEVSDIPLPAAIWLMGAGLAGLGFAGRKKKAA